MPIPKDISLQSKWIHKEWNDSTKYSAKDTLQQIIDQDLLVNALSYSRWIPKSVKATFKKMELAAELIPVPKGTVLDRLNPKLLPTAGDEIQSAFPPLNGTLIQDYQNKYYGQNVFSQTLVAAEVLVVCLVVPENTTSINWNYAFTTCALLVKNEIIMLYTPSHPEDIVTTHIPYLEYTVVPMQCYLEKNNLNQVVNVLKNS